MEEAITAALLADPGLAALAADRVTWGLRQQGSALPAVVLMRVDGAPVYCDDGETGLFSGRLQVDCWGATYASAKTLARAVKALLSGARFTQGGVEFQAVWIELEQDLYEQGTGSEPDLYRTSIDFGIWHS